MQVISKQIYFRLKIITAPVQGVILLVAARTIRIFTLI